MHHFAVEFGQITRVTINLAQAARQAGFKTFSLTVNQAYPTNPHSYVGGVINTTLGLPALQTNYGTFTPGVVDGQNWPELVDLNTVAAFSASSSASSANNAAISAVTSQLVVQMRLRVDEILAMAVSTTAGLWAIGSSTFGTNKKMEGYVQMTATPGTVMFVGASYSTGNVRSQVTPSGNINLSAFPLGCYLNFIVAADFGTTNTLKTFVYDDNGVLQGSGSQALAAALSTDGGAIGCLFLNKAYNGAATSQAMRFGGFAVMSGAVQSAPAIWQPPTAATTGLLAWYQMIDANSGLIHALQASFSGTPFLTSGNVIGAYDVGGPFNWGLWNGTIATSWPGGLVFDETQWSEFHNIATMTGPTTFTLNSGYIPTVTKARSLGISSRGYLFAGGSGAAIPQYGTYITSPTTATNFLQAYVTAVVGGAVTKWGTAQQGGIKIWDISNEPLQGGNWQSSPWYNQLGAAWVPAVAAMVHTIDPTCIIQFNVNNIELAANTGQKLAAASLLNAIIANGVPAANVAMGNEFHLRNDTGFQAADQAAYVSFITGLPSGVTVYKTEGDVTDVADPGTGTAQRTNRQLLTNQVWQAVYSNACLGSSGVWARFGGVGFWQKNPTTSWLNVNPPAVAIRTDDLEWSDLTDIDYSRIGGPGSPRDVYGTISTFLHTVSLAPSTGPQNIPAGMTLVSFRPGNVAVPGSESPGPWGEVLNNSFPVGQQNLSNLTDATVPWGGPIVTQVAFPAGIPGGDTPSYCYTLAPGSKGFHNMYWAFAWKMQTGFVFNPSSTINKIFYGKPTQGANSFLSCEDNGTTYTPLFNTQSPGPTTDKLYPNVAPYNGGNFVRGSTNFTIAKGAWALWEVSVTLNTNVTPGSYNGVVDIWINNVHTHHYTNIGITSIPGDTWAECDFQPYWGGSGSTVAVTQFAYLGPVAIYGSV